MNETYDIEYVALSQEVWGTNRSVENIVFVMTNGYRVSTGFGTAHYADTEPFVSNGYSEKRIKTVELAILNNRGNFVTKDWIRDMKLEDGNYASMYEDDVVPRVTWDKLEDAINWARNEQPHTEI